MTDLAGSLAIVLWYGLKQTRVRSGRLLGGRKQARLRRNGRDAGEGEAMSAFEEHKKELEHYETMMGPHRGRLAVTLDLLTNALVLVGQHGVYCHTQRDPDEPVMDIRLITAELRKAKELIQSVMEELRAEREKRTE
jgi:hypothetical protein